MLVDKRDSISLLAVSSLRWKRLRTVANYKAVDVPQDVPALKRVLPVHLPSSFSQKGYSVNCYFHSMVEYKNAEGSILFLMSLYKPAGRR
jgi:hypothetical protein